MSKQIIVLDDNEIFEMPKRRCTTSIYEMSKQAEQMGCGLDYIVAYNNGWNDCLRAIGDKETEVEEELELLNEQSNISSR